MRYRSNVVVLKLARGITRIRLTRGFHASRTENNPASRPSLHDLIPWTDVDPAIRHGPFPFLFLYPTLCLYPSACLHRCYTELSMKGLAGL